MKIRLILKKILLTALKYVVVLNNLIRAMRLRNFASGIKAVRECNPANGNRCYAIFVYHEPHGQVSKSARNILAELHSHSVDTILISNHELSPEQQELISPWVHKIIERDNQGFDFGSYKDGVAHLKEQNLPVEKLIILNDSVYYFRKGLDDFVRNLLGSKDAIAAFENWEAPHAYHLQSFALSISKEVYNSKAFTEFWTYYRPVSNRLYAIENGEKELSKTIVATAKDIKVIYSITQMLYEYPTIAPEGLVRYFSLPKLSRREVGSRAPNFAVLDAPTPGSDRREEPDFNKYRLAQLIGTEPFSPIHAGAYYFARMHCPMVKKDLVFRGVFDFWEVETMFKDHFATEELEEFLDILRKKGDIYSLSLWKRLMTAVGAL